MADLMSEILASVYLGAPGASFWRWSDEGEAIEWTASDGPGTILFRGELAEVMARLAPQGLPSLSALVLLLGACRDGWEAAWWPSLEPFLNHLEEVAPPDGAPAPDPEAVAYELERLRRRLERVVALAAPLRRGVEAKAVLAEAILEGAPRRLSPAEAEAVVLALREHVTPAPASGLFGGRAEVDDLLADLEALNEGLERVDGERLLLRLRTGLEAPPAPAEVGLPPSVRVRALLGELTQDPELGGLARLARDLLACVRVPRHLLEREELPLGGVADVANRGPLDRLLASELAHDDLTLAVRVATGEALYLRRESPPRRPPARRAVLLDHGVRLWGLPRLFGAAVTLALAADADAETALEVFAPRGAELAPLDPTTREGLLALLELLEPAPHPGAALPAFFEACRQGGDVDAVLVTHPDVLADPAFRAALRLEGEASLYVATVDADGEYRLDLHSARGRRRVAQARLRLEDLLPGRSLPGAALRAEADPSLPAAVTLEPFPFLLPHRVDPGLAAIDARRRRVLTATADGRLMLWERPGIRGARQLTARLPRGRPVWVDLDEDGLARCLVEGPGAAHLVTADPARDQVTRLALATGGGGIVGAHRLGGLLVVFCERHLELFHTSTGDRLPAPYLPPATAWRHGRLLQGPGGWSLLERDGLRVRLRRLDASALIAAWERPAPAGDVDAHEGLLGLLPDGAVTALPGGGEVRLPGSSLQRLAGAGERPFFRSTPVDPPPYLICEGVSQDGHRLLLRGPGDTRRLLLDLAEDRERWLPHETPPAAALEPALVDLRRPQVRRRFSAIGVDEQGRLALVGRRRVLALQPDASIGGMRTATLPADARLRRLRRFTEHPGVPGTGLHLRVATWRCASRALLDSRGLLHLQPARPDVPELSFVLAGHGRAAVWSSDGHRCGPDPFLPEGTDPFLAEGTPPDDPKRSLAAVADALRAFVEGLA